MLLNKKDFDSLSDIVWSSEWVENAEHLPERIDSDGLVSDWCRWTEGNDTTPVKAGEFPAIVCLALSQDDRRSDTARGIIGAVTSKKTFDRLLRLGLMRVVWVDDGACAVAVHKAFADKFEDWDRI